MPKCQPRDTSQALGPLVYQTGVCGGGGGEVCVCGGGGEVCGGGGEVCACVMSFRS